MSNGANKKLVIDVRPPDKEGRKVKKVFTRAVPETQPKIIVRAARVWPRYFRIIAAGVFFLLIIFTAFSAIGFWDVKNTLSQSAGELRSSFQGAGSALKTLQFGEIKDSLLTLQSQIQTVKSKADRYGLLSLAELGSQIFPKLKALPQTFLEIGKLGEAAINLTAKLEELKDKSFYWLTHQEGNLLSENLEAVRAGLAQISEIAATVKNQGTAFDYPIGEEFLGFNVSLYKGERFVKSLARWFKAPGEKHLALLFQNPSELRPGGGFLGSYADLAFTRNGLQNIKVWDIYDPDGQLDIKVIPPKPLQGITTRWGARDANWFFDFPTSAKKVIRFLEASKIYTEQGVTFDGALALNVPVIESILGIIGPVELPEYKLTITRENLLTEIQREVEAGRANRSGEPKRILKVLTPIMFQEIGTLDERQKQALLEELKNHILHKDILVYFKDLNLQGYLENFGLTGEVIGLPNSFEGDYLAVVSANVAGGKSDAYVSQKIRLSSKIDAEGRIDNYLIIEKIHTGDTAEDSWHRATNKSYVKIFTPRDSRLTYLKGHEPKTIKSKIDYLAAGYLIDDDLRAIEETSQYLKELEVEKFEESDKTVFAAWMTVKAGTSKKLEAEYFNPQKLTLTRGPIPYRFIFEKQSGAKTSLDFLIEAPPGYHFKENGEPIYNYVNEDPPGRLILDLTLLPK